jgi:hypothetical protein
VLELDLELSNFVLPSTGFEPTPLIHCSTIRLALRPAPSTTPTPYIYNKACGEYLVINDYTKLTGAGYLSAKFKSTYGLKCGVLITHLSDRLMSLPVICMAHLSVGFFSLPVFGSFATRKIDIAFPKIVLINTETFYISLPKISLVNFRSNA